MFPTSAEAICSVAPKPPFCTDSKKEENHHQQQTYQSINRNVNSPEDYLFQGWNSVAAIRLSLRVYSVKTVSMKNITHPMGS